MDATILMGKTKVFGEKPFPFLLFSTTNLMWTGLKLNLASVVGGW
jgi:hypothetical protein